MNGHRGATLAASSFLLHDRLVEADAREHIQRMLDREWAQLALFAPAPVEPPAPEALARLLQALEGSFGTARHIGHDVIYPTFALRIFRQLPESVTRARIDGLCTMAAAYARPQPVSMPGSPAPFDPAAYSAFVLESFLTVITTWPSPGISTHLLTFGYAVIDLHLLGYASIARLAEAGHREIVPPDRWSATRWIPATCSFPKPAWMTEEPHQAGYWRNQPLKCLEESYGHAPKVAYAFLGLCAQVRDPELRDRARAQYHHAFSGKGTFR